MRHHGHPVEKKRTISLLLYIVSSFEKQQVISPPSVLAVVNHKSSISERGPGILSNSPFHVQNSLVVEYLCVSPDAIATSPCDDQGPFHDEEIIVRVEISLVRKHHGYRFECGTNDFLGRKSVFQRHRFCHSADSGVSNGALCRDGLS